MQQYKSDLEHKSITVNKNRIKIKEIIFSILKNVFL